MKKLLALVLALVMTLGLATVSSSAAYTDQNDIEYDEAAAVMTAVGVFQGKGDAFAPKDNLNRAEAAKLVAYLMLGNKTAEAMQGTGAKFADVPASHWASGYIEYLATAGVVSGVGGGNFDPNGQVTAVQFAKMLLVALGYDAEIEGFTGTSSWAINIQKLANDNDLYSQLDDLASSTALTREQAAQMCLNDLKADMVEYESKGTTVEVSGAKVTTDAKKATVQVTSSDKGKAIDNLTATGISKAGYVLQLGEELYNGDLKLEGTSDDMGRPSDKWSYKTETVGEYAAKSDLLLSATKKVEKKAVYSAIGKDAVKKLEDFEAGKTAYAAGAEYYVYVDGKNVTGTTNYKLADLLEKDSTGASAGSGNGINYELFLSEGDNYDTYTFVLAYTYLVKATADYNSSTEKLRVEWPDSTNATDKDGKNTYRIPEASPKTEISQDDFNVSDVKEDDYLVVTYSASDKSFQSVAKTTTLTGKVDSYKSTSNVVIDGTTYEYNKTVGESSDHGTKIEPEVGAEIKVILDPYGYIILVDDTNYSSTYLYVDATSTGTLKTEAEVYFLDGTTKTINVKKVATSSSTSYTKASDINHKLTPKTWYTYTVNSNGDYSLKLVDKPYNTEYKQYSTTINGATATDTPVLNSDLVAGFIATGTSDTSALKANNDTVVLILDDDDDVSVYTGISNMPKLSIEKNQAGKSVTIQWTEKDNFAKYVFVDASAVKSDIEGKSNDEYVFVAWNAEKTYNVGNDNKYVEADLYYDKDQSFTKKVKVDLDAKDDFASGTLVKRVRTDSKTDYLEGAKAITTSTNDEVVATGSNDLKYDSGTITINGTAYSLKNNRVVLVVKKGISALLDNDAADYELNTLTGSGLNSKLAGKTYTYKAYGVRDDDGSKVLKSLYIYITDAADTNVGAGSYTVNIDKDAGYGGTFTVSYKNASGDTVTTDKTGSIQVLASDPKVTFTANTITGARYNKNGGDMTALTLGTAITVANNDTLKLYGPLGTGLTLTLAGFTAGNVPAVYKNGVTPIVGVPGALSVAFEVNENDVLTIVEGTAADLTAGDVLIKNSEKVAEVKNNIATGDAFVYTMGDQNVTINLKTEFHTVLGITVPSDIEVTKLSATSNGTAETVLATETKDGSTTYFYDATSTGQYLSMKNTKSGHILVVNDTNKTAKYLDDTAKVTSILKATLDSKVGYFATTKNSVVHVNLGDTLANAAENLYVFPAVKVQSTGIGFTVAGNVVAAADGTHYVVVGQTLSSLTKNAGSAIINNSAKNIVDAVATSVSTADGSDVKLATAVKMTVSAGTSVKDSTAAENYGEGEYYVATTARVDRGTNHSSVLTGHGTAMITIDDVSADIANTALGDTGATHTADFTVYPAVKVGRTGSTDVTLQQSTSNILVTVAAAAQTDVWVIAGRELWATGDINKTLALTNTADVTGYSVVQSTTGSDGQRMIIRFTLGSKNINIAGAA